MSSQIKDRLDITNDACPITFVKTKLKLEGLESGDLLEVIIKDGEPLQNVPRSIKGEGHKIISMEKINDDTYKLIVQKGE
ncbi:MAG: sulfurtransferase TusA family protein [Bacillota bacterium]|nr:sulfurtransferase TusA family protein [Bacillota bacterium]